MINAAYQMGGLIKMTGYARNRWFRLAGYLELFGEAAPKPLKRR
jgi:hypothetical protein